MPGEFDLINWIQRQSRAAGRVLVPPGDDLAVLKWDADDLLLVGVDQVLDGVHFDSTTHSPREIGRKVMNRNLSDCAAMACLPAGAVATVALPRGTSLDYAQALYKGMREAGDPFDCPVVGGDTASWGGKLVMTVSILGRSAGIAPITRKGAQVGDLVYVSGPLGGSILGRHMRIEPRIELARQLARTGKLHAMIDLSDGLSRDVRHICAQSGVGIVIDADAVPVHADAVALSARDGREALEHALDDGEDHELLYTGEAGLNGNVVGRVVGEPGVFIARAGVVTELQAGGWEHRL